MLEQCKCFLTVRMVQYTTTQILLDLSSVNITQIRDRYKIYFETFFTVISITKTIHRKTLDSNCT